MTLDPVPDYTPQLQRLMQQAGLSNLKELSQKAGVSELQLIRLQRGLALQTRADVLLPLSHALKISLAELLATFAPESIKSEEQPDSPTLEQEYLRLKAQLAQQRQSLMEEFQQQALEILEPWLVQWPTAAKRVKEHPQLDAVRILPLVRPVQQLVQQWGVEEIAPVGAEVAYDPQLHQLIEGTAQPGEPVQVRYTGYYQGGKLLYRAKVSPIE